MNAKQEMPETMRSKEQTYFQTLIELAPNEIWEIGKEKIHYTDFVDIERVKELKNDLDNEIWHFRSYLMGINQHDRITVIEYTILELLTPYAITRRAMKQLPDQERDKGRATMLLLYNAISRIIWLTKKELKLSFTADFTEYLERGQINKFFYIGEVSIEQPKQLQEADETIHEKVIKAFDKFDARGHFKESDFIAFTDALAIHLSNEEYNLPNSIFLRRGGVAKIAKAVYDVYLNSMRTSLIDDTQLFDLMRVLSTFEHKNNKQIYYDMQRTK